MQLRLSSVLWFPQDVVQVKRKSETAEIHLLHLGRRYEHFHIHLSRIYAGMVVFIFKLFSQNLLETLSGHSTAELSRCFQQLSIQVKKNKECTDYRNVFKTGVRKALKARLKEFLTKIT